MPDPQFFAAYQEMCLYYDSMRTEENTFLANFVEFAKTNPLMPCFTFSSSEQTVEYATYMASLGETDIEAHLKILNFFTTQLKMRLRTKSNEALAIRADVELLTPVLNSVNDVKKADMNMSTDTRNLPA